MTQDGLLHYLSDIQSEIEELGNLSEINFRKYNVGSFIDRGCRISLAQYGPKDKSNPVSEYPRFARKPINPISIQTFVRQIEYLFELDSDIEFISGTITSFPWQHVRGAGIINDTCKSWKSFKSLSNQKQRTGDMISMEIYLDSDSKYLSSFYTQSHLEEVKIKKFNEMRSHIGDDIIYIFQELFDQYGIKESDIGGKVIGQQWKSIHITKDNIRSNPGYVDGSIAISLTSVEKKVFNGEFFKFLNTYIYPRITSLGYHIRDKSSLNTQIRDHYTGNLTHFEAIFIEINSNPFNIDSYYWHWNIYN